MYKKQSVGTLRITFRCQNRVKSDQTRLCRPHIGEVKALSALQEKK